MYLPAYTDPFFLSQKIFPSVAPREAADLEKKMQTHHRRHITHACRGVAPDELGRVRRFRRRYIAQRDREKEFFACDFSRPKHFLIHRIYICLGADWFSMNYLFRFSEERLKFVVFIIYAKKREGERENNNVQARISKIIYGVAFLSSNYTRELFPSTNN